MPPNDSTPAPLPAERVKLAPVVDTGEFAELLDSDRFAQIQRVAKLFSESTLIPETFQGKPANCAVALQMAFRMRIDPMLLMQSMYVVYGRPGIEAKLAIALMNQRGPFTGPLQWEVKGEGADRSWTCFATHKVTGEKCAMTVTWKMAVAEGWVDKKGSKWLTIPDMMGRYRSAAWLGRLYCPEVLLGLPFDDELRDRPDHEIVTTGERVIEDEITMPQPKAEKPAESGQNGAQASPAPVRASAIAKPEPEAAKAPESVDTTTGEVRPAAITFSTPIASPAQAGGDPGGDLLTQQAAADPMNMRRLASRAQREMIIAVAIKRGLTEAQLNKLLGEKFTVELGALPVGLVSDALNYVGNLKP
jgi:hypothetical protein